MQNELEIKRKERAIAIYINVFFYVITLFIGMGIANLVNYATFGTTIGGRYMGFATVKKDGTAPGLDGAILYWLARIVVTMGYYCTFGILYIYEIATMEKRNGNLVEAWLGIRKIERF